MVLGGLCGHREWMVGEFVVACRVGLDEDGVRASPLLPVDDWSEPPWSVGLVVDGQQFTLLVSDSSGEMESLMQKEGI